MATTFIARPAQAVTTAGGDQIGARVAMLPNGGHVVAWNSNGDVIAQAFDASGARVGGEMLLFSGHALGGICALADGSLVVCASRTWAAEDGSPRSSLYFERLDASGHVLVGPALVDDTGNYDEWVSGSDVYAMPGGGFAITDVHTTRPVPWQSISESIRVYDGSNTYTGVGIPGESGFLQETAHMANGGFVVEGTVDLGPAPIQSAMWRTVDAQGNTIASASLSGTFSVNGYTEGGVVALADGRALVVWDFLEYSASTGIAHQTWQAQWIDATGYPSGAVFNLQLDSFYNPTFTALADGSFVATWTQQVNYNEPSQLYAQHFTASAQPDSAATLLASIDAGGSYTVVATPDGGFIVASQQAGNGKDVWEQEFDIASASQPGLPTPWSHYPGIDEVTFPLAHTGYMVTQGADGPAISGPDGTVLLTGIERVHFSDGYAVALDVTGHAGEAYRLYQAAFDRAPDLPGLGFQTNDLDMGYSLAHVAQNFIDSPEFQSKYGPGLSNAEFITLLYRNVLDREPEPEGLQYHLDEFAHGDTRANMLTHFSESPENQANVIGQIGNGMLYIPYA